MAEQEFGHLAASGRGRRVQGGSSASALCVGVGARSQQLTRDLQMTAAGGRVQRRVAGFVERRGLGARGQKCARCFAVAAGRGHVQGRGAAVVARVRACAGVQQQADGLAMSSGGGAMQRRGLALPPLPDAKGIAGQDGPHRVRVAGACGLMQVGHRRDPVASRANTRSPRTLLGCNWRNFGSHA